MCFFFFKQKTAYEMRISDWSSDVCSSDLAGSLATGSLATRRGTARRLATGGLTIGARCRMVVTAHQRNRTRNRECSECPFDPRHDASPHSLVTAAWRLRRFAGIPCSGGDEHSGRCSAVDGLAALEIVCGRNLRRLIVGDARTVSGERHHIAALRRVSQADGVAELMGHYFLKQQRSEEHTSELQSLIRISYSVFC